MSLNERPTETLFLIIARKVRVFLTDFLKPRFDEQIVDQMLDDQKNRTFITIQSQGSLGGNDWISDIFNRRHPH